MGLLVGWSFAMPASFLALDVVWVESAQPTEVHNLSTDPHPQCCHGWARLPG